MHLRHLLFTLAALPLLPALSAQVVPTVIEPPAVITIGTGFDYSRGDYGLATPTELISVPVIAGYDHGPWTLEARLPWLRLKGPATIVAGGGGPTRPDAGAVSGLGDLALAGTYRFSAPDDVLQVATTVRAKLPTADDARGLGTGRADFSGQLDLAESFGAVTPFASLGYAVFGDSSVYQLEDGPFAAAGAHLRASDRTVFTAAYTWRHRLVAGGAAGSEATLAVTHDFSPRWRLMVYALRGFTDASPDTGGGLQVSCRF